MSHKKTDYLKDSLFRFRLINSNNNTKVLH